MGMKYFPPYLDQGSCGPSVIYLKLLLSKRGFRKGLKPHNPKYDMDTASCVRSLQRFLGFSGKEDLDGNFGPGTRRAYAEHYGITPEAEVCGILGGKTKWLAPGSKKPKAWPPKEHRRRSLRPSSMGRYKKAA